LETLGRDRVQKKTRASRAVDDTEKLTMLWAAVFLCYFSCFGAGEIKAQERGAFDSGGGAATTVVKQEVSESTGKKGDMDNQYLSRVHYKKLVKTGRPVRSDGKTL